MKHKFNLNDRVDFMVKPNIRVGEQRIKVNNYIHLVGYIKTIRKTWWGAVRYIVAAADKNERGIFVVPEKHIFGLVEKKDKPQK